MDKSYYGVLSKMAEVALSGTNESTIENVLEVSAEARKYPLTVIDPLFKNHTYQGGLFRLRVDLYFVDLVYQDRSNELDVINDMVSTAIPYVNYLREHEDDFGFYFRKETGNQITFQTFSMKWADFVAGVKVELFIDIPDNGDLCKNLFNE